MACDVSPVAMFLIVLHMWQYLKRNKFGNFWRLLVEISETFSMIQIAQLRSELKLYFTAATIPPQYQAGVGTAATIKTVVTTIPGPYYCKQLLTLVWTLTK